VDARVNVITLAVGDLERSLAFYRDGLGLATEGLIGTQYEGDEQNAAGAVVMFHLDGGLTLALYPRSELARDAGIPAGEPQSGEFSIGQIVGSAEDVDAVLGQAEAAGAEIPGPARERPWGIYSGYFRDPDGHLWEVIWSRPR
jgi:catechol 2,3-dioxygenase-like lactoylglutathione lyase family enzyme